MNTTPLRAAVLVGSTREGRLGRAVADWVIAQLEQRPDMAVDVIDLAEVDLPPRYPEVFPPAVQAFIARIAVADAFVVVTPEYNHGYPAALKHALDFPYQEWNAKPVGLVTYGARAGGVRAAEQLRQVFAELHAVTMRDQLAIADIGSQVDDTGVLREPGRYHNALKTMADQLAWWAEALRRARTHRPYAAQE